MPVQFFDITRQNAPLKEALEAAIKEVADSGRYILGSTVENLEKEFAAYCGTKFAVGVASGTDALHLSLHACGVGPGDEVITSPFTFVATAEVISYCGANPVFCDIDPKTFNLDATRIEARVTRKTKAILPVHLYGQACEMDKIMEIAKKHKLSVVEDCAQATGAEFDRKKVGSQGTAGAFSFFPTKNLGCFGDGGAITTNDEKIYEELKVLRNHGTRKTYHHDIIGYNSRLDALQAAIIKVKLPHLDKHLDARRKNAELYSKLLKDIEQITLPFSGNKSKHTYNQFTLMTKERDRLVAFLRSKGIGAMVYYPLSLHLQKAFENLGHKPGDFSVSEAVQAQVLSLPIFPELKTEEIEAVCSSIKDFFNQ